MKIQAITLKNFRQYRDFRIEFDHSSAEENVTVLRAKNSTGKTTLAQSILWCLYGDDMVDLDLTDQLINKIEEKEAKDAGEEEVQYSVEIEILDNDTVNYLKRTQVRFCPSLRKKKEIVEFAYIENGERINKMSSEPDSDTMKLINRKINSILSQDIARNFVFDGERIEKIADPSKKRNRDEISNAISSMSLLPTVKNSLETLNHLYRKLRKNEAENISDEVVELENRISFEEKEEKRIESELLSSETRRINVKNEIDEIDFKLLSYSDIAVLQQEKLNLEKESTELTDKKEKLIRKIYNKYTDYLMKREVYKLYKKYDTLDIIDSDFSDSIPNMTTDTLDFLIERGVCVCGTDIDEEHLNNLEEQKRYQPPISPESLVKMYEKDIYKQIGNLNDSVSDIRQLITEWDEKELTLFTVGRQLDELEEQIDSTQEKDIQVLRQKLKDLSEEHGKLNEVIDGLQKDLVNITDSIAQLNADFSEALKQKSINDRVIAKNKILQGSIDTLQDLSNRRKSEIREEIERRANIHFSDIISKEKIIQLHDNFEHKVKDSFGKISPISSGESIAVSMSIILAIIETHKNRIIDYNNDLESHILTDKEFFLVMDGPFAVLDQDFSSTISSKLANTVEQIILLTNDNQYNDSVKKSLVPKLSKEYILDAPVGEEENLRTEYLTEVSK